MVRIIPNIAQNTPEWDEYRLHGIGSSDAGAIVGASKYMNAMALYRIKVGEMPETALENPFTAYWRDRGQALEPEARERYQFEVGWPVRPAMVVHDRYDWMRASLDGLGDVLPCIIPVEIKCPGKGKLAEVAKEKVPSEWWPQCQHVLMVTEANFLHLYVYDGKEGKLLTVFPDLEYQAKLLEREKWFWGLVQAKVPPDLEAMLAGSIKRKRTALRVVPNTGTKLAKGQ